MTSSDDLLLDELLGEDTQPDLPGRTHAAPHDELTIVYVDDSVRSGGPIDDTAPFDRIEPEHAEPLRRASSWGRRSLVDQWEERTRIVDFDTPDLIRISQRARGQL